MRDLPVAIALPGALAEEVAAWADRAGWRVVGVGDAPVLLLDDGSGPILGCPRAVVVDGAPDAGQVRTALHAGALDVIGWPEDRERLLDLPDRLAVAPPSPGAGPRRIGVAGAGGGTGTSTVALAVGALLAWGGRRTIVVGDEDLLTLCACDPWRGPGVGEVALLDPAGAAAEVPRLARPVPGVPGLSVLGGGVAVGLPTGGWPCDAVVLDLRGSGLPDADLVCARPDAHVATAAGSPGGVVVVGEGPLSVSQVRTALGRAPVGALPMSARVARAGASGRVPSALPGSWLAALRGVLVEGLR